MFKSLMALVKNNNGKFKSEKQAAYFMDLFGGFLSNNQRYYGNIVQWDIYFDLTGIQSVTKMTIQKGVEIYWENTPEHLAMLDKKAKANEASKKEEALLHFQNCYNYTKEVLDQLIKEYNILNNSELMKEHNIDVEPLKESNKKKINKEMLAYQEAIAWTLKYKPLN